MKYEDIRSDLRSGDIVFYSNHSDAGDELIKWWQRVLKLKYYKYSHIGIISIWYGRVILYEASYFGGTRMIPLSQRMPSVIFKTDFNWSEDAEYFAISQLGKKYSIFEAIGAGLGLREAIANSKYICTEFVGRICDKLGYEFPHTKQLPAIYFEQLIQDRYTPIFLD